MPDVELKRLRELRARAEVLLATLVSDLKPFQHDQEINGFRRKPDSPSDPDDVNVTTTCSCLMALTLSGKLDDFYNQKSKEIVSAMFQKLLGAPWMSSGLAENNAFTTTLIIRLLGFLVEGGVLPVEVARGKNVKFWESHLEFSDFGLLARKLVAQKHPFPRFLFRLFPLGLQNALNQFVKTGGKRDKAERDTAAEISRLIRTTAFYEDVRFRGVHLSKSTKELIRPGLDAYHIAQLNRYLLHDFFKMEVKAMEPKSLRDIADDMIFDLSRFKINDYPPAAAVLYWFVDGIVHARIKLGKDDWTRLCTWAKDEFGRQRSLVVAKHAAMMDPVAMGMAACLCARLRGISNELRLGTTKDHHEMLPSTVELERSIIELLGEQTSSGILPKYFPLFHYQDAGSNFCFTFELLEALLVEFGGTQNKLLSEEAFILGIERALNWCDTNRLRCAERMSGNQNIPYSGWNSGGNLQTLQRGQPESWATAVVHMFLWELVEVLARRIQQRLLEKYAAKMPTPKWKKLEELLDIELWLGRKHPSLKATLGNTIIKTFQPFTGANFEALRKCPVRNKPLSALLFGPPGTSKTEVAKGVAAKLNWALVEIDPSHFLRDSYQNIYVQAERIFEDVMDLCGVVVLFDEMDALVQKRDGETAIDTESKFLTTYMLPKLAKLHDRGQLAFFMATNFQANFDDAIKRAGRFDFLLCMGPPTLQAKCKAIHLFFELREPTDETKTAGELILEYAKSDLWLEQQLNLYTYGEFLSFISEIAPADTIGSTIKELGRDEFLKKVRESSKSVALKWDNLAQLRIVPKLSKWKKLQDLDRIEFNDADLTNPKVDPKVPVIKYILDRKQTRRQCVKLPLKSKGAKQGIVHTPP